MVREGDGVYAVGFKACATNPGSYVHEEADVRTVNTGEAWVLHERVVSKDGPGVSKWEWMGRLAADGLSVEVGVLGRFGREGNRYLWVGWYGRHVAAPVCYVVCGGRRW